MSIISCDRAAALISDISWEPEKVLRVFWLKVDGSRDEYAVGLSRSLASEEILSLVVRDSLFVNPNQILSDAQQLFDSARPQIENLGTRRPQRLTVVLLIKHEFRRVQVGSPITLPTWFPVRPGLETYFFIADLVGVRDGVLLNSTDAQIERIAELLYELESSIVCALSHLLNTRPALAANFVRVLSASDRSDPTATLDCYRSHLRDISSKRGYRPNASTSGKSLVSDLLRRVLSARANETATLANELASAFPIEDRLVKPSFLTVFLRPKQSLTLSGRNWHAILIGVYHAYQAMNASAHAGDYDRYSVGLVHYASVDLQDFLTSAGSLFE